MHLGFALYENTDRDRDRDKDTGTETETKIETDSARGTTRVCQATGTETATGHTWGTQTHATLDTWGTRDQQDTGHT